MYNANPASEPPPKEDVAEAIFRVLRNNAQYLASWVSTDLHMAYERLDMNYYLAILRWMEVRYFAGGLEPITQRLDQIEAKLDKALVYEYKPDDEIDEPDDEIDEPEPDADAIGREREARAQARAAYDDVPHLDYDGTPL